MTDYVKVPFTGRAGGKPIQITATSLATAQTIHTTNAGTGTWDEIWLWVTNPQDTPASVTIAFGYDNTNSTIACKDVEIPANSEPVLILAGTMLQNSKTVKAYASVSGYINVLGYVKRV
jgi:hypothetical protein